MSEVLSFGSMRISSLLRKMSRRKPRFRRASSSAASVGFHTLKATDDRTLDRYISVIEKRRVKQGSLDTLKSRVLPSGTNGTHGPVSDTRKIKGSVVYWMSRDQRVNDNWALIYSMSLAARSEHRTLHVVFCLVPSFLGATLRAYHFMLEGLRIVEEQIRHLPGNVRFSLLQCEDSESITIEMLSFCREMDAHTIVTDFGSLRISRKWILDLVEQAPKSMHVCTVDSHNIVPIHVTSDKLETRAFEIRPKIESHLRTYLCEFPSVFDPETSPMMVANRRRSSLKKRSDAIRSASSARDDLMCDSKLMNEDDDDENESDDTMVPIDWDAVYRWLKVDQSVGVVPGMNPGVREAFSKLHRFLYGSEGAFENYASDRNNPLMPHIQSGLSAYIHFGQISAQRIAYETKAMVKVIGDKATDHHRKSEVSFFNELIIWREMTENFCHYNDYYDSIKGAQPWARRSLQKHANDRRQYVYSYDELDQAQTHDDLWNAAQRQMVVFGKMHGFLRMYWAKKILEWTDSPEIALDIAITLNDRYSLDGRDPNGYGGCMWSICGTHDRDFAERPVTGKIRPMTLAGCKRKFNVRRFIQVIDEECARVVRSSEKKKTHSRIR